MNEKASQENEYRIKIQGTGDFSSFDWISIIKIVSQEDRETVFEVSLVDQPALRGFLDQLWNYNFKILSVEYMSNKKVSSN